MLCIKTPVSLLLAALLLSIPAAGQISNLPHPALASQSVPWNMQTAATGGAGVAVPSGVTSSILNPAMLHTELDYNSQSSTATISYSRDSLFERNVATVGGGMRLGNPLSIGLLYRFLQADKKQYENDVVLNLSGHLFDQNLSHGVVNLGLNIRYERFYWQHTSLDSVWSMKDDTIALAGTGDIRASGFLGERRLSLDLGIFQANVGEGLDFGISISNLLGYLWGKQLPHVDTTRYITDSALVVGDTIFRPTEWIDSIHYADDTLKTKDWQNSYYRTLNAGIAFHKFLLDDRVFVNIPLDIEILGLFDRKKKSHLSFRTGLEAWIKGQYCARFGFAREPAGYPKSLNTITNATIFSGGAGVRIERFSADVFVKRKALGIGATIHL